MFESPSGTFLIIKRRRSDEGSTAPGTPLAHGSDCPPSAFSLILSTGFFPATRQVGNLFKYCVDSDLKDETVTDASSHHSFLSFLSVETEDRSVSAASRSFEDSIGPKSEIIYAMKSIHLDQLTLKASIDELR
jgi:hypothetical protein